MFWVVSVWMACAQQYRQIGAIGVETWWAEGESMKDWTKIG